MKSLDSKEIYRRVAQSTGKTLDEIEESIAQLIEHVWPILTLEDQNAISAGQYPTQDQFLAYLVLQTQAALGQLSSGQEKDASIAPEQKNRH